MDKAVETVDKSADKLNRKAVLGIYAKQPRPGRVKTRLCPPLSAEQAAEFYACVLGETVARARGQEGFTLVICYDGEPAWFAENFPGVPLLPQQGVDLGARMCDSFAQLFRQGYQRVALIGSDAPDLPLSLFDQAFTQLQQRDLVLAPAKDGGYVLIGQAKPHPELFSSIPWSSSGVLAETLRRATTLGLQVGLLPQWEDLDDLPALQRLLQRSPQSRTAAYLREHLQKYFPAAGQA